MQGQSTEFLEFVLGLVQTSWLVMVSRKHKFMELVYNPVSLVIAVEYEEQFN